MEKFMLGFWIFLFAAICGLIVKFILDMQNNDKEVTWNEYLIGLAITGIALSFLGVSIGWGMARNNLKSFNELWGGWEAAVWPEGIVCTKDGQCIFTYPCDPWITYTTECDSRDKDGNCTSSHQEPHTHYHSCPIFTVETNYLISDTFGDTHTIASHCIDPNPQRWGLGTSDFEQNQSAPNACVGAPAFWSAADYRVNILHQPGPAFKKNTYDNLVIAADQELYKEVGTYVQEYLDAGLLPMVVSPDKIHDYYLTEPIYFVGFVPSDPGYWQDVMRYLDGGFGDELHGTVHVVITQNPLIDLNPDRYIASLKAYWQDPKYCGDNCFPKNGVLIVVGTNGVYTTWGRAETGMPVGNTDLIQHAMLGDLTNIAVTPEALLGRVVPEPYIRESDGKAKVRVLHPNPGAVESLIWGLKTQETIFVRISMKAKDPEDVGTGFNYLDSLIRPTKTQQRWIVAVCSILSTGIWLAMALYGERKRARRRQSQSMYR